LHILLLEVFVPRYDAAKSRRQKVATSRQSKGDSADKPKGGSALRKTGIRVIGDLPWGSHICLFYETENDLLESSTAYFKAGLESNEFCVWAISTPITQERARNALQKAIPGFDRYLPQIEFLPGHEFYLEDGQFQLKRITTGWDEKLRKALAKGFDGLRVSGNAFWIQTNLWKEFCEYEHELDQTLKGQSMIVLCTYSLRASRATDILDVARAHQFSIARRNGEWEFLETPELTQANAEIRKLNNALNILSKPFPDDALLTTRERAVLAQIVRGLSSKEAGRALGISPRTVEFHRANIMQKLNVHNIVDLIRRVLGEDRHC
jgi:DNA-binding CsgD family transcriptional regulator